MKQVAYAFALCLLSAVTCLSQSNAPSGEISPHLKKFTFEDSVPLKIVRDVVPSKPFTVVGPRGAAAGTVELKRRATGERMELSLDAALARIG